MKEIMNEWRRYTSLNEDISSVAKSVGDTINYAFITTESVKIFQKNGFTLALANALTKNIVNGIKQAVQNALSKGMTVENTAIITSNLIDGLNGIFQICTKFGIDPAGYFSRFLGLTTGSGMIASALTFFSVLIASKGIYDWLDSTGREFEKSKGSLAIKELRQLETRIKEEGFEAVKKSEANTSIKQGEIATLFSDAIGFYPDVAQKFPTVFNLLDKGWQKRYL